LRFIPTDVVRWNSLCIEWNPGQTLAELRLALGEHLAGMTLDPTDPVALVELVVTGPMASRLYLDDGHASWQSLSALQRGLSADTRIWPVRLDIQSHPPRVPSDGSPTVSKDLEDLVRHAWQDETHGLHDGESLPEGLPDALRRAITQRMESDSRRHVAERAGHLLSELLQPAG
jgi:hypothetical protein